MEVYGTRLEPDWNQWHYVDKLDMFPKSTRINRGDSSETPGLGLTRCLSSKAREV